MDITNNAMNLVVTMRERKMISVQNTAGKSSTAERSADGDAGLLHLSENTDTHEIIAKRSERTGLSPGQAKK